MNASWSLCSVGIELPLDARMRIAGLWRTRVDLRDDLLPFVGYYPCDEFLRGARKLGEHGTFIDYAGSGRTPASSR